MEYNVTTYKYLRYKNEILRHTTIPIQNRVQGSTIFKIKLKDQKIHGHNPKRRPK